MRRLADSGTRVSGSFSSLWRAFAVLVRRQTRTPWRCRFVWRLATRSSGFSPRKQRWREAWKKKKKKLGSGTISRRRTRSGRLQYFDIQVLRVPPPPPPPPQEKPDPYSGMHSSAKPERKSHMGTSQTNRHHNRRSFKSGCATLPFKIFSASHPDRLPPFSISSSFALLAVLLPSFSFTKNKFFFVNEPRILLFSKNYNLCKHPTLPSSRSWR